LPPEAGFLCAIGNAAQECGAPEGCHAKMVYFSLKNTKRLSGYTMEFKQPQRMVTGSARQQM